MTATEPSHGKPTSISTPHSFRRSNVNLSAPSLTSTSIQAYLFDAYFSYNTERLTPSSFSPSFPSSRALRRWRSQVGSTPRPAYLRCGCGCIGGARPGAAALVLKLRHSDVLESEVVHIHDKLCIDRFKVSIRPTSSTADRPDHAGQDTRSLIREQKDVARENQLRRQALKINAVNLEIGVRTYAVIKLLASRIQCVEVGNSTTSCVLYPIEQSDESR